MIKKITPAKNLIKKERSTSCFKCCSFDENDQEQKADIVPKMLKIRQEPYSFTPIKQEQEYVSLSNYTLFTPRTSHFPSRTNSYNKTILFTSSTVDHVSKTSAKIQLKSSQLPLNPLERLKRKLTLCSSSKSKHEKQYRNQSRITFCYISAKKDAQNNQHTVNFDVGSQKSVQLQEQLQKKLQQEVEQYKKEYQQLLQQFKVLRQEKQRNKQRYEQLIFQIKLKQEQIKALQNLRRDQIQNLREQLRRILQEQAVN